MDGIEEFSHGLADRIAAAAAFTVGIQTGQRPYSGILWRPDVVVVSEQTLPRDLSGLKVLRGGQSTGASLAGRDPSTNVAVLKLESPLDGALPISASALPRVGSLALVAGADTLGAGGTGWGSFTRR